MQGRYLALALLALGTGLGAGVTLERLYLTAAPTAGSDGPEILYWVAPMDPNFRRDAPGKSPMGMDLIPVYEGSEPAGDPSVVQLDAAEINAIGVRTALATSDEIAPQIRTVGFAEWNEHRTAHIHTRVEGWIERLEVRAIGDRVAKGDLLFELFSPEVGAATAELVRAIQAEPNSRIVEIAKNRLRSIGLEDQQIERIATTRQAERNIAIYAPQDGVVVALEAAEGMYLKPDVRALTLTDPAKIWVIAEVFERDLGRLSLGMRANARFDHLPGTTFAGQIDYIYPELDKGTRTLPVRLVFDNANGQLRPGMFSSVTLEGADRRMAVTVPSEALIRTGRAERVILKTGDGTFRPRLVTTGLRDGFGAGGRTEVIQGLQAGEEVVASAQFLIDSESVLNAGMMRMAPTETAPVLARGKVVSVDPAARRIVIAHEPVADLDWPAMETGFTVAREVDLQSVSIGDGVEATLHRGADGQLWIGDLMGDDGIAATGHGVATGVTADGRLSMSHDPIPELGWGAMRMDMALIGVDPASVPLNEPVAFDLARDSDGMFAIVAVRPESAPTDAPTTAAPPRLIEATGTITAIDAASGMATISHGPLKAIGMPAMTMDFALAEGLDPASIPLDTEMPIMFEQADDMSLRLASVTPPAPLIEASGTIEAVTADTRMARITHGPMRAIGMPGMTMEFPLAEGLDPATLPIGQTLTLQFAQRADMSLELVQIAAPEVGQ
ncbi:Cu(I)/Ag(I) efflux system membrane fusion protein [Rhodobacter aestuarii]|uniref:Membrane fusion protein, Cu(I)/Ag(I) efflux system n=1 Tax=Rhodobacter aestuarii TaxID=453582 RepID=A0A1N7QI03_9RHOB|nr:efflux RND transporter periplasmic adaptor subunit [Rhodobacter aestuarii]PTV93311.1 Cu(I)/Ag(I) efflux system membrane fusion protein [Rhodobacter aestuarii]SIT22438.1 membrane fusion protein, Cu(I)/Ag(I) efflux system [Rhodobacter aestuarii]